MLKQQSENQRIKNFLSELFYYYYYYYYYYYHGNRRNDKNCKILYEPYVYWIMHHLDS